MKLNKVGAPYKFLRIKETRFAKRWCEVRKAASQKRYRRTVHRSMPKLEPLNEYQYADR